MRNTLVAVFAIQAAVNSKFDGTAGVLEESVGIAWKINVRTGNSWVVADQRESRVLLGLLLAMGRLLYARSKRTN